VGHWVDPEEDGVRIELDRSDQVLELDCPEVEVYEPQQVVGSLADIHTWHASPFVCAAELIQKAKIFDDGLFAAVELGVLHGSGSRPAKTEWLGTLRAALGSEPGAVPLYAAAGMLDPDAPVPESLAAAVAQEREAFLSDELRSRPISFYSWSTELSDLFRHDRMLQCELRAAQVDSLLRGLHARSEIRGEYERTLALIERLTNPLVEDGLRSALRAFDEGRAPSTGRASLLPASVSHETRLMRRLYGTDPIPDDFDLMAELIQRIRSGALDLAPTAESGWYDRQLWSLAPLASPEVTDEAAHLIFGTEYRSHLEDLLKAAWALARETHAKQVEVPFCGAARGRGPERPTVTVYPDLTVEPLMTHYRRRAEGYRFVRGVVEEYFGSGALRSMRRLTPEGPVEEDLDEEISFMEALFDGAARVCAREIGAGEEAAAGESRTFRNWKPRRDPDLGQDIRMMVPVFYDVARQKTKVWAVLGWSERELEVSYRRRPAVVVRDRSGADVTADYDVHFAGDFRRVPFPEVAEVYVDRVLDRAAFRALCDRHGTREAILEAL
jgi:hypothetical protein